MDRRAFLSRSFQLLMLAQLPPRMFAENSMLANNQRRNLSFSNDWIDSVLVTTAAEMPVEEAIVVNLSSTSLQYSVGQRHGTILPWKSAMLRHCVLVHVEAAALLHVRQRTDLGGVALTWEWYGQRNPQFPRRTPLYISPQDDLGEVQLDPFAAFSQKTSVQASPRHYQLKLNLWYTPEETNCGIHTGHRFLEVHTQILGTGRMQKFREDNAESLYEDIPMLPGYTHDPFFVLSSEGGFSYPWHRYYAETDCVWMAIEMHPL